MDVDLLLVLCVVRDRSLGLAARLYRAVLPSEYVSVCVCVCDRKAAIQRSSRPTLGCCAIRK